MQHLVVTPARNEAENLQRLGGCLVEQTWRPQAWVVVDNGSTDGTADVVRELGREHPWIRLLSIEGDDSPDRGSAAVRAFNAGVSNEPALPDLVTNLDADVSFEATYFESLREEFVAAPQLGIASGLCHELHGDAWQPVHVTHPHLRGAARTFRRECLAELLPLEERFVWDGIDVVRANVRGWRTGTIPRLQYFHHRRAGERDASRFASFVQQGRAAHYMWYRPSYLVVRTLYRMLRDPAAGGLVWGYARAAVAREPRHAEEGFGEFVHSTQSFTNWRARAREARGKR